MLGTVKETICLRENLRNVLQIGADENRLKKAPPTEPKHYFFPDITQLFWELSGDFCSLG